MTTPHTGASPAAPTLYQQMGGPSGIILSSLPILIVIFGSKRFGLGLTLLAALGVAAVYFAYCVLAKKSVQPAISGFIGVGIGAVIAWFTGEAKGFFLYGIWMSLVYAIVFVISMIVRWPAVGVIWLGINGHGMGWRKVTAAVRFYDLATAFWALVFAARFIVQRWLYDANNTDALGWAKIAMGWPLTAIAVAVTVWAVKKAAGHIDIHEETTGETIITGRDQTPDDAVKTSSTAHATTEQKDPPPRV